MDSKNSQKDGQIDYKDTLILPKTAFPMKANLPQNEPLRYAKWREFAYKIMSSPRKNHKNIESNQFNLHDGPPYANGHLHVGHALNKILKDFIVKLNFFNGKQVFFTPGWDCHGLPIEQQVSNAFEEKKIKPTKIETREACREHAKKFVEIQKSEFESMGIIADFDNPYLTMKYRFEADIFKALTKIAENGLLTQRSKPIFWSWAAKSALAEAEVEYKDKKSDSIFVKFPLSESTIKALNIKTSKPFAIIWTTTPWTLPSNVAIAFKPDETYVLCESGGIVAEKLYEKMLEKGIISGKILQKFNSKDFENLTAINPLNNRESKLILADYVSLEDGSGSVHNAPGHGEDDYFACLRYNLPVIMPVDDGGCYDSSVLRLGLLPANVADEFVGMHIFKAQKRILEMLKESGALLKHEEITHSYPHCWRTNKPVIFRATKQWFILMDKPFFDGKTLREIALSEIEKTRFYPANGINRIKAMVENRPDWCISRQREWGVPIAFFIDKNSGEPLLDSIVTSHIADLFEKNGCDIWWSLSVAELLPQSYKGKAENYTKNMHILDVWFDSGSTWFAVLKDSIESQNYLDSNNEYNAGTYPANVYLEGSDQHRGWFQSSLLVSCAINKKAPFKTIITHGFTIDEKSEKMSKSKGNVLAPSSIISQQGSEILRLWVALSDYQNDVKISQNILKQVSENYLKLRNTLRFLLANTSGLKTLEFCHLSEIDKWVLHEFVAMEREVRELFSAYDFSKGFQLLNGFITATLSGIYLDICKDSLYCDALSSPKRVAIQSTFGLIANHLLHILAPFLTYTIDEALEYAENCVKNNALNVFELERLPLPKEVIESKREDFSKILNLRSLFNENIDKLKKEKIIKSSLELEIVIESNLKDSKTASSPTIAKDSHIQSPPPLRRGVGGWVNSIATAFNIESKHFTKLVEDFLMVSSCLIESNALDSKDAKKDSVILDSKNVDSNLDSNQKGEILFSIESNGFTFHALKSKKEKCPRCWQYKLDSKDSKNTESKDSKLNSKHTESKDSKIDSKNAESNQLCPRCLEVIKQHSH
ncbi:isoleucine--tRNA ligase [Helicobacter saguini]|uniref:Isoleucine--tRNA ligase n=1 Tax=Helicobacter saguini TaxID=1548018 RepID=A0A6L7DD80_9HELI|nr:isoleucine--tRNA ligase [Helicobacter saguini]MWV61837.1 isoleucine--tRNA ligase [Helicobacter saguini]MWV69839.1 isoleucine--tRNA ligase [Helicobacter saguini]MWV72943.1 isoleucine--tRNA ligase [Helicobacter saguini]